MTYSGSTNELGNMHHPNFGKRLKEAMDAVGVECVRSMDIDYQRPADLMKEIMSFL